MRYRGRKGLVGLGPGGWRHQAEAAPGGGGTRRRRHRAEAAPGGGGTARRRRERDGHGGASAVPGGHRSQKIALCTLSLSMGNIEPGMTRANW
jgi:hypothetical protein